MILGEPRRERRKMKISLCMIVRDEELALPNCLESVKGLFSEIIIVDTGSTDKTVEIAREYTDKVYFFDWCDDFSAARNFAFSKAEGDYLAWLDADDVIEDRGEWLRLFELIETERPDVVILPYNAAFDESGKVILSYDRERIVRAGAGFRFVGAVHEAIELRGKIIRGEAAVCHRKLRPNPPGRNLKILDRLVSEGKPLDPRMKYYYARELLGAGRPDEAERYYRQCAEDGSAWAENRVSALFELSGLLRSRGRNAEADSALLGTLLLGEPRADVCCEIGRILLERGNLGAAKLWYSLAPVQFRKRSGGFVPEDCGGYLPYMQLCVICDRLGESSLAESYNELAGRLRETPEYLFNKRLFAERKRTENN